MNAFSISSQGSDHKILGIPCQDSSGHLSLRIPGLGRVLAVAVADGLGSCSFSEQGAHAAIDGWLATVQAELTTANFRTLDTQKRDDKMMAILRNAMEAAADTVRAKADGDGQPVNEYETTLSGAILFENGRLFISHCGDGGIAILHENGVYRSATTRHKGDFFNSVVPLSIKASWEFRSFDHVCAAAAYTDGLWDHFVSAEDEIFWPFLEPALRPVHNAEESHALEEGWRALLAGKTPYFKNCTLGKIVRDDLSMAIMARDAKIMERALNKIQWNAAAFKESLKQARQRRLYGLTSQNKTETRHQAQIAPSKAEVETAVVAKYKNKRRLRTRPSGTSEKK